MPFRAILQDLVDTTPGALGAVLTDWEGEAVEQYCLDDDYELRVIGAHKGIIINLVRQVHQRIPTGALRDTVISSCGRRVLIGVLDDDYSLVMTMHRSAPLAPALRRLRLAVGRLKKEI